MKLSRRARLRQRHYGRMHKAGGLNLVSLMDIFTILVFFLMVNSSDVKVMQNTADVPLPSSTAKQEAVESLTVQVVGQSILVQGPGSGTPGRHRSHGYSHSRLVRRVGVPKEPLG